MMLELGKRSRWLRRLLHIWYASTSSVAPSGAFANPASQG